MFPPQLLSQTSLRSRVHSTRAQLYWKDKVLKLLKKLFRTMKNNMQDFFPQLPRNSKQPAINLPLSQHSKALTESLFLTLLHRKKKIPFIFHLFSFLPERQKRVGFYVHQIWIGLFCSALDCGRFPSIWMHTWIFTKKKSKKQQTTKKTNQYCPSDLSMACYPL